MRNGKQTVSLAKIARPTTRNIIERQRLFTLLEKTGGKPVTWVSALAGSGKTTLVSSYLDSRKLPSVWYQCDEGDTDLATFFYYMGLAAKKAAPRFKSLLPLLTPEYLAGISTFTRRYFEELYGRLTSPRSAALAKRQPEGVIVLDNYQDVSSGSPFHEMIANGFDIIPEGLYIIVISRSGPPSALARLQANNKIRILEYNDIRFTFEESKKLVRGLIPGLDNKCIKAMHEKTEGWAAGMILMFERARIKGTGAESAPDFAYDGVFDYFAGEIFNRTEKAVQEFLLKTAFLPALSVPLAEKLTGVANAGRILSSLNRHHHFTERLSGNAQGYKYHTLFRDFLLNMVKTRFTPAELTDIRKETALLLEKSGQIEDAARLYCDAGDRDGISRMVISHARELVSQGRNKTVEEWIECLPGGPAEDNPWLLYWTGICSFPVDMRRARKYLEKAFESFRAMDEVSGIYLSWAGIVDTYAFGLDRWKPLDDCIAVFEDLGREYPSFPSKEIALIASSRMLIALTLRKTDEPEWIQRYLERVTALLQENPSFDIQMDTVFAMNIYYLWKGEYYKNAILLERAEADLRYHKPSPFAAVRIKLIKGVHCWITAEYASALSTLSEGLDIAARTGVHVFDSLLWGFRAAAEMAPGNMEPAGKSLNNQMTSSLNTANTLDVFFYHINSAWYAMLKGNPSLAAEHMETIAAKGIKMGTPYYRALWNIGMAQVAFLRDRAGEAKTHIQTAHRISIRMKSYVMEWYSLLISAWFLLKEGREKEGLKTLQRALSLGQRHGYVHLEFYLPSVMQFLFSKALEEGIEQEYVKGLIRKLGLTPPHSFLRKNGELWGAENWPYPVKIHTLGRFEIIINERPLEFSKKVPKKPLELLKALIAFGSKNVPVEKIIDALWPEVDGDAAYSSFKVNLHHLRRLLGSEEAVHTGEGRISLNLQFCHLDVTAFQYLADKVTESGAGQGRTQMKKRLRLAERAIGMYRGNFIDSEGGYPHIAALRERLRSRFVRLVEMTGRYYEGRKQWHTAIELYEKGIETDEFQEEFYKCLMVCFKELGRYNEAAAVYNRCRRMLRTHFGVEPSACTKAVYEKLV